MRRDVVSHPLMSRPWSTFVMQSMRIGCRNAAPRLGGVQSVPTCLAVYSGKVGSPPLRRRRSRPSGRSWSSRLRSRRSTPCSPSLTRRRTRLAPRCAGRPLADDVCMSGGSKKSERVSAYSTVCRDVCKCLIGLMTSGPPTLVFQRTTGRVEACARLEVLPCLLSSVRPYVCR